MSRHAYVSHHGGVLCVWLDSPPSIAKDQRDPDGWAPSTDGTPRDADGLIHIVTRGGGAERVTISGAGAEWWARIRRSRQIAASRKRNAVAKAAQTSIPIDAEVEREGRDVAARRREHLR